MINYLSVTEYAHLHKKDPGNIRRLLATGRLSGQKAGNQWIIPSDAVYPDDRRTKSGKYRNWRNKILLNKNVELMAVINDMVSGLQPIYGELLSEIILYGSYARGTQTDESDVDIAILLRDTPSKSATTAMIECVSAHELECGKVLSVIDINADMYAEWRDILPFYRNIYREGITLWKAV